MRKPISLISAVIAVTLLFSCSTLQTADGDTITVYINVDQEINKTLSGKERAQYEQVEHSLETFLFKLLKKKDIAAEVIQSRKSYNNAPANYMLDMKLTYSTKNTGQKGAYGIPIIERIVSVDYSLLNNAGKSVTSGKEKESSFGPASQAAKSISMIVTDDVAQYLRSTVAE